MLLVVVAVCNVIATSDFIRGRISSFLADCPGQLSSAPISRISCIGPSLFRVVYLQAFATGNRVAPLAENSRFVAAFYGELPSLEGHKSDACCPKAGTVKKPIQNPWIKLFLKIKKKYRPWQPVRGCFALRQISWNAQYSQQVLYTVLSTVHNHCSTQRRVTVLSRLPLESLVYAFECADGGPLSGFVVSIVIHTSMPCEGMSSCPCTSCFGFDRS